MKKLFFDDRDRGQIALLGMTESQILEQIALFGKGAAYVTLDRPCTPNDGIFSIPESGFSRLCRRHQEASQTGRFLKFVPASGAASRMFDALLKALNSEGALSRNELAARAAAGDVQAADIMQFLTGLKHFAFYEDLRAVLIRSGCDPELEAEADPCLEIVAHVLLEKGLDYARLPKGLLKFHQYPEGSRTALEEHLMEAVDYVRDAQDVCRLHLTVSPEHLPGFEDLLARVRHRYEQSHQMRFEISFSIQKKSTDTMAVDADNRPFRDDTGNLLFRPGGHGALLENLNDLQGDLIYLKNIDNVTTERQRERSSIWKKVLGGYLVQVQDRVFGYLQDLAAGKEKEDFLEEVRAFGQEC